MPTARTFLAVVAREEFPDAEEKRSFATMDQLAAASAHVLLTRVGAWDCWAEAKRE